MGPGDLILSTWCVRRSIAPDLSFHRSIDLHLLPACYSEHSMKFYPFFGSRMQKGYLGPSFGSKLESPNEQSTFDLKAKASSDSGWGCLVRPKILRLRREIFLSQGRGLPVNSVWDRELHHQSTGQGSSSGRLQFNRRNPFLHKCTFPLHISIKLRILFIHTILTSLVWGPRVHSKCQNII